MKTRTGLQMAGLVLLFALVGCIPSLHPLYTEADLTFDPSLIGVWSSPDSKETWTVTRSGEKEYHLAYLDEEGKKGEFVVHLLKVEGRLFADFYPVESGVNENEFYKMHLLRVHTFARVRQIEPTLLVATLKPEWMENFLGSSPDALRHEKVDGSIVLTAKPKELQAFLVKHETTAEAWSDFPAMTRRTEKPKE